MYWCYVHKYLDAWTISLYYGRHTIEDLHYHSDMAFAIGLTKRDKKKSGCVRVYSWRFAARAAYETFKVSSRDVPNVGRFILATLHKKIGCQSRS
jgi:hypothetical protein